MSTVENQHALAPGWSPLFAAVVGVSAIGGHLLLLLNGRNEGVAALVTVAIAVTITLAWSERHNRGRRQDVRLARQRIQRVTAAHQEAVRNEQRFRALVLNASETITILDREHRIEYSSPSVQRLWGYSSDELQGGDLNDIVHPQDAPRLDAFLETLAEARGAHRRIEFRLRHRDGSWRHLESVANNLLANPSVGGIVLNSRDSTERKKLEEKLTHQAFHDPLTGLPNRALFMDRLQHALAGAGRVEGGVAVVSIDVDRFKTINDSLGHAMGDAVLIAVSRQLAAGTRRRDTVARLGGDEFAMLLEVRDEREAIVVGERLLASLERPLRIGDRDIQVALSIGIGVGGGPHRTPSELLRAADLALYQAKRSGRGRCVLFDSSLDSLWVERLELENAMKGAVERGEFTNFYQPLVDLHSGDIVGMEALVRWNHPERGILGPDVFIPLAEETGEIQRIGSWVLTEACREARSWQALRNRGGLVISVNVSARQLQQPEFVDEVAAALEDSGLDPGLLQLEITESLAGRAGAAHAPAPRRAEAAGRAAGDRRLRYRLLLAQLPQPSPGGRAQAGPQLRRLARSRRARGLDRARDHHARARAAHRRRRRGHRDGGAAGAATPLRLLAGARLPLLAAGAADVAARIVAAGSVHALEVTPPYPGSTEPATRFGCRDTQTGAPLKLG